MEPVRGGRIVAETLRSLGITDLFTLPGAQTMGLYDELRRAGGFTLHSSLQDTCAVGAADGFGRVTGRLACANVYEFAGFANAVCSVYSALIDRAPLLILGTLTDGRQSGRGWSAEIPNLVGYAQQVTKLALEVPRADRLEELLRRAVQVALTPPCGPVYVGIPAQLFVELAPPPSGRVAALRSAPSGFADGDPAIARTAALLLGEEQSVLVAGSDVADASAIGDLEALAAEYALPVYMEPYSARAPIGSDHPCNFRVLTPSAPTYRQARVVVAIGARLAKRFSYFPFEYLLPHQTLCHFHVDPAELARVYPTEVAVATDAKSAIAALRAALARGSDEKSRARVAVRRARVTAAKAAYDEARARACTGRESQTPADAACVLHQIGRALRPGDIVVDELIGLRHWWPGYLDLPRTERYFGTNAGFMGWGAAAATGIALGMKPGEGKAVLLAGDGCFLMAPQALWSAAHERAPVVFIVMNNRGWVCLKGYYDVVRGGGSGVPLDEERIGCDFDEPTVDYVSLARGFGVPGRAVRSAAEIAPAMAEAFAADGPFLLDVDLAQHTRDLFSYPKP